MSRNEKKNWEKVSKSENKNKICLVNFDQIYFFRCPLEALTVFTVLGRFLIFFRI